MNSLRPVFARHAFRLLFILLLPAAASAQDSRDARRAEALWEQAVAAKGGRGRLYEVGSLLISYRDTARNFLGVVVHRGDFEALHVFPDRIWTWDDALPPPFKLTVGWLDLGRNRRCVLYEGAAAPACAAAERPGPPADEGLVQTQYLYLLETRWVKPTPVGVGAGRVGLKKVDVLHARFRDRRIDYFLDRETRLPLRVSVFRGTGARATLSLDFSEYASVGGVMLPGRQGRGRIDFQINPPYDESVFTRPPSLEAGPHAWRLQRR
jgi:hypothetical protein